MLALRAWVPLRMRVRRSAIGSVIMRRSPARFGQAGDLSLAAEVPETQPTHPEAPVERPRAPAERAAVVRADLELRRPRGLHHQASLCHFDPVHARKGMPSARRSALPSASVRAVVQMTTVSPLILSTLSRLI